MFGESKKVKDEDKPDIEVKAVTAGRAGTHFLYSETPVNFNVVALLNMGRAITNMAVNGVTYPGVLVNMSLTNQEYPNMSCKYRDPYGVYWVNHRVSPAKWEQFSHYYRLTTENVPVTKQGNFVKIRFLFDTDAGATNNAQNNNSSNNNG